MYWRALAALAAIAPAIIAPVATNAQSNAEECWYSEEIPAVQVQNFQTLLMVGTFKCRDHLPEAIESYNRFMNSKRDFILANQRVVQNHFTKAYGTDHGNVAFLDHQTRVGNIQSLDAMRCESIVTLSRLAADASEADLLELASYVSGDDGMPICTRPEPATLTTDAVEEAAPAAAPPVVVATVSSDETIGVEDNLAPGHYVAEGPVTATAAAEEAPAPAKMVTVVAADKPADPAPVETSAVAAAPEPDAAPAAAPTPAQALQEAAKALALAAKALEAQASAGGTN